MKINSFFAVCFCVLLMSFASCKKFLDIRPKGILIPQTAQEYENLLNGYGVIEGADYYPVYMTDDAFLPDSASGELPGLSTLRAPARNLYTFQSAIFGESEDDVLWEGSYTRLYYYNVLDKNVLTATNATEEQKQAIRAEALMGRAFEYLTLINAYAVHYDPQTMSTDPGVPLLLDEDINKKDLTRATVEEVYKQIETDLLEAAKYLPTTPKINAFRASLPGCHGLLARMYLCMGNYTEALKYANKVLEHNSFLLDLKQYKVVNIHQRFGRTNVQEGTANAENIYIRWDRRTIGASGNIFGSKDLLGLFNKEKDQRFLLYFSNIPYGISSDYYLWVPYLEANLAIATPEMYLTAAECEARIGEPQRAMTLINNLRDKRIFDNVPLTATSKDDALEKVLEERRRELAMTGCFRLTDLKRLNKDPRFAKTIKHNIFDADKNTLVTYTLLPNDPKYILPIPPRVLRFNPNMQPNVR